MYKAIVIALGSAAALIAQGPAAPNATVGIGDGAQFGPIGITAAMAGPMATIAGAPYSAEAVTERVQILADGNRIHQTTSGTVARDSQGRVRREESLPGLTSAGGDPPHLVLIMDPVAKLHWTLDPQKKIATKMPMGPGKPGDLAPFVPPPAAPDNAWFVSNGPGPVQVQVIGSAPVSPDHNLTKVDLGLQNMEGVPAQGTRTTRTLPAGSVGNDQPIVITTETWYSPDLKVLVLSKTNDPRMGATSYKLTNIQRSEPPADLFEIPSDYTVSDQPAHIFRYQTGTKTQ
jgi:hypothetical protein